MSRAWAMPNALTFTIKPIKELVTRYLDGVSIDPFARDSNLATYTNDLNPATNAQSHMFASEFLQGLKDDGVQADVIIFDPPYSLGQTKQCYQSFGKEFLQKDAQNSHWGVEKDLCADLLVDGGVFLHFGWHSNGLGKKRNCEIIEIMLVAHGGGHHDTICTVERKNG